MQAHDTSSFHWSFFLMCTSWQIINNHNQIVMCADQYINRSIKLCKQRFSIVTVLCELRLPINHMQKIIQNYHQQQQFCKYQNRANYLSFMERTKKMTFILKIKGLLLVMVIFDDFVHVIDWQTEFSKYSYNWKFVFA